MKQKNLKNVRKNNVFMHPCQIKMLELVSLKNEGKENKILAKQIKNIYKCFSLEK